MASGKEAEDKALEVVTQQLAEAVAAAKCHKCGCLQQTVEALSTTDAGKGSLADQLSKAKAVFQPKKYDCLGCAICWPAIAANAFAEAFPAAGEGLDLCPTEEPEVRKGWPPLPGDHHVVRSRAPVAVCTLNSGGLAARLNELSPEGLSIAGTLHTENLGIERIIKNVIANPHLRFLILCGEDTQQAIGHLPGQTLQSLFQDGVDERQRIIGAKGKRPFLKNVTRDEIDAFLKQIELVPCIGEIDEGVIVKEIGELLKRDPGPVEHSVATKVVETVQASEQKQLKLDKAGYLVVYPDARRNLIVMEHYTNQGVLDCIIEGVTTAALYSTAIGRGFLTVLDHAAYIGAELARAENSLLTGAAYVQDKAAGEIGKQQEKSCGTSCQSTNSKEGKCGKS